MYLSQIAAQDATYNSLTMELDSLNKAIELGNVGKDMEHPDQLECTATNPQSKLVCDEHYRGPYYGFWHDESWVIDTTNCSMEV